MPGLVDVFLNVTFKKLLSVLLLHLECIFKLIKIELTHLKKSNSVHVVAVLRGLGASVKHWVLYHLFCG